MKQHCNYEDNRYRGFSERVSSLRGMEASNEITLTWPKCIKGRGWSKTGVCYISVNNQWIFTKFSAVVHYVMSHQIIKFQLICIIYAWISHNSKVPNEERYSEKTNYSKHMFSSVTCSLHSRGCNSYFEIC